MQELKLEAIAGPLRGQTFVIRASHAVLGRSQTTDVPLEDGMLSRRHCMITCNNGEAWVQDLGSSNGTLLDGVAISSAPQPLRNGSVLTLGETLLRVHLPSAEASQKTPAPNAEPPPESTAQPRFSAAPATPAEPPSPEPTSVQLFPSDTNPASAAQEPTEKKRASLSRTLIGVLGVVCLAVILIGLWSILMPEEGSTTQAEALPLTTVQSAPLAVMYDHIRAGENTLYHFALKITPEGACELRFAELAERERRFRRTQTLDEEALQRLRHLLADAEGQPSVEAESTESAFTSERYALTLWEGDRVTRLRAVDRPAPVLERVGAALEDFVLATMNVASLRQPVELLLEDAQHQLTLGNLKWTQRDLSDGALFEAIAAYQLGLQMLDTLSPKPDFAQALTEGKTQADEELTRRYNDLLFALDQAEHTARYTEAQTLLKRLLRMIPDRDDARNQSATERLLIIEQRYLKKGGR